MYENKKRDLAIDAAFHRLALHRDPNISFAQIQRRSELRIYSGGYMCMFDGRPIASVTLLSDVEFAFKVMEE